MRRVGGGGLAALLTFASAFGNAAAAQGATQTLSVNEFLSNWLPSTDRVKIAPDPNGVSKPGVHYIKVVGTSAAGWLFSSYHDWIEEGRLRNGQEVVIVPIGSGGSGGVYYTLLFTTVNGAKRFVGYISSGSGHLEVHVVDGELHVTTPIYAATDSQCCPSRHRREVDTLDGIRLRELSHVITTSSARSRTPLPGSAVTLRG